ncbi:hypothetical protein MKY91_17415 [Alkalicoccobacillus gibsonii]|uniref:Uncharacterized protein n=1 Tax=Alkalicoccobacillus gibsonii TaxID=79881 RepID=A0ABU9VM80_9BACI
MSQHHEAFLQFMNSYAESDDGETVEVCHTSTELSLLVPSAVAILRDELASNDPDRRLKAAIAVMEMNQKQNY